jgi:hypothetical protein
VLLRRVVLRAVDRRVVVFVFRRDVDFLVRAFLLAELVRRMLDVLDPQLDVELVRLRRVRFDDLRPVLWVEAICVSLKCLAVKSSTAP